LDAQGEHTPQSHLQDKVQKLLPVAQAAAVEDCVRRNIMANATEVQRSLVLVSPELAPSPSKARIVQRTIARCRERVLHPFTQGEKLKGDQGSLTRLCEKIYLRTLVEDHNAGRRHLQLHQPVCVGYQFEDGVTLGI